jgi:beta-N-acetylhexosaminidase
VSGHLGGIVYFGWAGNIVSPGQLALLANGLQRAAGRGRPFMIAVDQETGQVARLGPALLLGRREPSTRSRLL